MQLPEWFKPGAWGVVIGAVGILIVCFIAGVITWTSTAEQMASDRSQQAVVSALVPICLVQAKSDPEYSVRVIALKKMDFWKREEKMVGFGWAIMPGSDEPRLRVVEVCVEQLLAQLNG